MIEINLIAQKKPFRLPVIAGMDLNDINFKACIIIYILFIVAEYGITTTYQNRLSENEKKVAILRAKANKLKKELKGNDDIKQRLDAYYSQIDKLKERSKQVQKILDFRKNPVKVLEKIGRIIPEEVWIEKLSITENDKINLEGEATSYKGIGDFISAANEAAFFGRTLNLQDSKTEDKTYDAQQVRIEIFKVEGKIKSYGRF